MDFSTLDLLRLHHPAWRLLRSDHAPLVVSFLHRVFVAAFVRSMAATDLAEALEDELYALRQVNPSAEFPKPAMSYLNDWAAPDKGWLRKFYKAGTDEAQFDLTPATEKAIAWLVQLSERQFVGTESRLLTLFDLLKQMSEGSEADPDKRLAELQRLRDEIDAEMALVRSGHVPLLEDVAIKDRFLQFMQGGRELLSDFREVEHNFRLDAGGRTRGCVSSDAQQGRPARCGHHGRGWPVRVGGARSGRRHRPAVARRKHEGCGRCHADAPGARLRSLISKCERRSGSALIWR